LYLAAAALALVWIRFPGVALSGNGNPDENFWIVSAAALLKDPRPWLAVDPTTGGALVPLPIILLGTISGGFGWGTARAAAILCSVVTVVLLYGCCRLRFGLRAAQLGVLPLIVTIALFQDEWDLQSFNSEHVANLLLASALFAHALTTTTSYRNPGRKAGLLVLVGLTGLFLGLVPWAKLQAAPLAALLGVILLGELASQRDLRLAEALLGGALLPTAAFTAFILSTGAWTDFWRSYLLQNVSYARAGFAGMFGVEPVSHIDVIRRYPLDMLRRSDLAPLMLVTAFLTGFTGLHLLRRKRRPSRPWLLGLGLVLAAFVVTVQTRVVFGHYLLLLMVPVGFLLAASVAEIEPQDSGQAHDRHRQARFAIALITFTTIVPAALLMTRANPAFQPERRAATQLDDVRDLVSAIDSLTDPGDRVAIWGWSPQLWIATATLPGTRDIHTERQLLTGPQQQYFTERFAGDLRRREPVLFLDAVGLVAHFADRSRFGYQNFSPVQAAVQSHYALVTEVDEVRIYMRRDLAAQRLPSAPATGESK